MTPRNSILTIGILWMVFGVISILVGIFGLIQYSLGLFPMQVSSLGTTPLGFLLNYQREATIAQLTFGILIVSSSIGFIQRKNWARWLLQIFAGINILWGIAFGYFWINTVNTLTTSGNVNTSFRYLGFGMSVFGIVVILVTIGMWLLCIRFLNRAKIRAEFLGTAAKG